MSAERKNYRRGWRFWLVFVPLVPAISLVCVANGVAWRIHRIVFYVYNKLGPLLDWVRYEPRNG